MPPAIVTTRPEQHVERVEVLEYARLLPGEGGEGLSDLARILVPRFLKAANTWERSRAANQLRAAVAEASLKDVRTASVAFKRAFERWSLSIDGEQGKGFSARALPPHLGNRSASVFLKSGARSRVDRMADLLAFSATDPQLQATPDRRDDLIAATAALEAAVIASEQAVRDRAVAVRALRAATLAFDRTWGRVVVELRETDVQQEVPRFRRGRGRVPGAEVPAAE